MTETTSLLPRALAEAVYFDLLSRRAGGAPDADPHTAETTERLIEAFPGATPAERVDAAIARLRDYLHGRGARHVERAAPPFALAPIERRARLRELFREILNPAPFDEAAIRAAACAELARLNRPARRRAARSRGARL